MPSVVERLRCTTTAVAKSAWVRAWVPLNARTGQWDTALWTRYRATYFRRQVAALVVCWATSRGFSAGQGPALDALEIVVSVVQLASTVLAMLTATLLVRKKENVLRALFDWRVR